MPFATKQPAPTYQNYGTDMLTICNHPLIASRLNLMRDINCPPAQFRQYLHEISVFLTYEAVRDFEVEDYEIVTPMEKMSAKRLKYRSPVVVSILRAGNGLLSGALDVLPDARVGFLGMYRDETTLRPVDYYANIPSDLSSEPVLVLDPMLATGHSALGALEYLKSHNAKDLRLLTLVSAPEGVKTIESFDADLPIYTASLDRGLNDKGYIMPGLGDAGDRIFNSH